MKTANYVSKLAILSAGVFAIALSPALAADDALSSGSFEGKSKHKRNDCPQVSIGLAVTREGIPVRCWVLPGNQNDPKCVQQVQKDLNAWMLDNVIWAMDRA